MNALSAFKNLSNSPFRDFQTKDLCSDPSRLFVLCEDDFLEVVPPLDDDLVIRF